nr:iron chelate uptake ABC transporter family permease subunit [Deinococcus sp. HSC-46F16]
MVLAVTRGSVTVSLAQLVQVLRGGGSDLARTVILDLWLPRALLAAVVGGNLAVAGVLLQSALRNPLGDPHLVGVSAGAGLAFSFFAGSFAALALSAFAGALLSAVTVYALAYSEDAQPLRLILGGKSTLLRLLARQLVPRGGAVLLEGRDLARLGRRGREAARSLGLLPQAPALPEAVTVRELVARGRFPHRGLLAGGGASDRDLVEQALRDTGITHLAEREVHGLSGGERQRAWIAMALVQQPRVLLLDEPTTYLDLAHAHEALGLLQRLATGRGMTLLMVLHDLSQASRFATRVVALRGGQVVTQGRPAEVITPPFLREVYGLDARVLPDPETGTLLIIPRS